MRVRYRMISVGLMLYLAVLPAYDASAQKNTELILKSIYFGGGSYQVSPGQSDELKQFILGIRDLQHYEIIIFSHTDNIGGKEYNEWLSKMRSEAVYDILVHIPVPKEQIKIRDFGEDNPLYTNQQHLGRRANRRVDVILVPVTF